MRIYLNTDDAQWLYNEMAAIFEFEDDPDNLDNENNIAMAHRVANKLGIRKGKSGVQVYLSDVEAEWLWQEMASIFEFEDDEENANNPSPAKARRLQEKLEKSVVTATKQKIKRILKPVGAVPVFTPAGEYVPIGANEALIGIVSDPINTEPFFTYIVWKAAYREFIITQDGVVGYPVEDNTVLHHEYGRVKVMRGKFGIRIGATQEEQEQVDQWEIEYIRTHLPKASEWQYDSDGWLDPEGNFFKIPYGSHETVARDFYVAEHGTFDTVLSYHDALIQKGWLKYHASSKDSVHTYQGFFVQSDNQPPLTPQQITVMNEINREALKLAGKTVYNFWDGEGI